MTEQLLYVVCMHAMLLHTCTYMIMIKCADVRDVCIRCMYVHMYVLGACTYIRVLGAYTYVCIRCMYIRMY